MSTSNTNLTVDFSACEGNSCNNIILADDTGDYLLGNPGGFGSPNPSISEVSQVTAVITFSDNTQVILDITDLSSGGYPVTPFLITIAELGLSDKIVDQVITINLTYSGTTIQGSSIFWTSSTTKTILYTCQTDCCFDKLMTKVQVSDCSCCQDGYLAKVMKGRAFLDAAKLAASCGQKNKATKLLQAAQFLCNSKSCQSC